VNLDPRKETLEIDNIGVDNNFFEVGGTSLDIIRVTDRLKEVLKRDIPNVHIFQYPTISALAEYFDSEDHLIDSNENVRTKVAERGKKHRMRHLEKKRGEKR
jgi:acyl carrier protein